MINKSHNIISVFKIRDLRCFSYVPQYLSVSCFSLGAFSLLLFLFTGCRPYQPEPPRRATPPATLQDIPYRPLNQLIPDHSLWKIDDREFAITVEQRNQFIHHYKQVNSKYWGQMVHRIRPGDTLFNIARRYYQNGHLWEKIYANNRERLKTPQDLKTDIRIYLPLDPAYQAAPDRLPDYYIVNTGDTLYKIAQRFLGDGSQWQKILNANQNQIPNPNNLSAGTLLAIPPR